MLLYNEDGTLRALGAEAADNCMSAEDRQKLTLVEWYALPLPRRWTAPELLAARFKLHLYPHALVGKQESGFALKPLPDGKTVVDVFADFLSYLFSCARAHVKESQPSGDNVWNSVKDSFDVILSHPNGWEGLQQTKMREAAVKAGLVPSAESRRIHLITEGEASINYCVSLGLAKKGVEVRGETQ